MASPFSGKWQCVHTDGLDDFLQALNMSFMKRKVVSAIPDSATVNQITVNEDAYLIRTVGPTDRLENLVVGKSTQVESIDGDEKLTADTEKQEVVGQSLVEKLKPEKTKSEMPPHTITRTVLGDTGVMVMTMEAGGKKCIRIFQKSS